MWRIKRSKKGTKKLRKRENKIKSRQKGKQNNEDYYPVQNNTPRRCIGSVEVKLHAFQSTLVHAV
jgi:hypothetical protein